jgi:hypothetical protein
MIKWIAIAIVALIAAFLVYAAFKPDDFRVERSLSIQAPPGSIFPYIADFHRWGAWSPYERKDPAMKRSFSGPESGVGAAYEYAGNRDVGSGRLEIIEAAPASKIVIKLDFRSPIEGHNVAVFTLVPHGDTTEVTWLMYGPSPYIGKVMQSIFDMDKMIGNDFAAGLQSLKAAAEKPGA